MKRCTSFVAALLVIAASVSTAEAVIHFEETFDTYADQAAFQAAWTPIGCGAASAFCSPPNPLPGGTLSQDVAVSGANSVLIHSPVGAPLTGDSAQRNEETFPVTPTLSIGDILAWSYDFYDISPTVPPYRQYANLQSSAAPGTTPAGQLIAMGLNNNQLGSASGGQYYMARILGFSNPIVDPDGGPDEALAGTNFIKLNDFDPTPTDTVADGPGARSEGWHNLKVEISTADGTSTNYHFFVDNVLAERVNVVGTPRTYTLLRMGAGVSSTEDAYYDNFKLEFIPGAVPTNDADFNQDGVIDAADYTSWRKFNPLATGATQATGDADGNGTNDNVDYAEWRENFGEASPGGGGSGAVPEPTGIVMLVLGLAVAASRRSR